MEKNIKLKRYLITVLTSWGVGCVVIGIFYLSGSNSILIYPTSLLMSVITMGTINTSKYFKKWRE